jgi:hypothetical protein
LFPRPMTVVWFSSQKLRFLDVLYTLIRAVLLGKITSVMKQKSIKIF